VIRADVAIVGGGVIGASIAHHLALLGVKDVVAVDRAPGPHVFVRTRQGGGGSTARATGGLRAQFATPIEVKLSLLARRALEPFADDTGGDAGYEPTGYLSVSTSPREDA